MNEAAVSEFLAESDEIVARVSGNLSRLEKNAWSQENLDELYRDIHTIKGSAQLFGYLGIGTVAHTMESCLEPVRRQKVKPSDGLLDALFRCLDLIEKLVRSIGQNKKEELAQGEKERFLPLLVDEAIKQFGSEIQLTREAFLPKPTVESPELVASDLLPKDVEFTSDGSIRVHVGLLDRLMNLVGEMVLVRNQVLQYSNRNEDLEFLNLSQRLDVVTSDLQDQVMRTRMQPIGNVIAKFQRLTRDLAKELGKQVDLTIQGKDTELDKTLLEAIKDPLTHIVRNSCDHGIETVAERRAAGKPDTGHVLISAFHEGGQVIIEVSDDGKGLNRKKILKKALDQGLVSSERAERLSDHDTLSLIFLPGFSTVEKVSAVSGRGVGMDVVRTNIEKIGGSVDLESVEGKGTTIRMRIPLTLAIVPAMLVKCGGSAYAIPQVKLVELVRVDQSQDVAASKIQYLQGKPVYELRGKILPLVDLHQVLGLSSQRTQESLERTMNVVVLSSESGVYGLIVDEVLDTADIVVKPLSKFLKALEVYSAATILGTGEVALILDPIGVAKAAHLSTSIRQEGAFAEKDPKGSAKSVDAQEYLLFNLDAPEKFALPLSMVNRLEEFDHEQVEYSGDQAIVQYRGAILPLIDLNERLGFKSRNQMSPSQVLTIVVQRAGKSFGIVVNEILDVISVDAKIGSSLKAPFGIQGSFISEAQVITVIDVLSIIEKESGGGSGGVDEVRGGRLKILYAEDVAFFRRQVAKLLGGHGYDVTTVEDGREAMKLLSAPGAGRFDLILSDIEMPHLNGLEFAQAVRSLAQFKDTPLIALTTRFSERDIQEGTKAGFDRYLEKLNPDLLITQIEMILQQNKQESGKT